MLNSYGNNTNSKSGELTHQAPIKAFSNLVRRLTTKEMEEKRQKGLCYWCDEGFVPGHKGRKRQFYTLSVASDD